MEENKSKIKLLLLLLLSLFHVACNREQTYLYLDRLSEDLQLSIASNDATSLTFGNVTFYIKCDNESTFSKLTYTDILNGYLNTNKIISPSEYVNDLFLSKKRIKNQVCLPLNNSIIRKYKNNFDLMVTRTSTADGMFFRNNLNLKEKDLDAYLFLYAQNGYLIGFDDYLGNITLSKFK